MSQNFDKDHQDLAVYTFRLVVPLALSILGFLKKSKSSKGLKPKSKALLDLEFISSFLAFDVKKRSRLVVEQAFAIHFRNRFDFEEVVLLLDFPNPSRAFNIYPKIKGIVELKEPGRFSYSSTYDSEKKRKRWLWFYMALYFVLTYTGLLIFAYSGSILEADGVGVLIVALTGAGFIGSIGISCGLIAKRITFAQKFIKDHP